MQNIYPIQFSIPESKLVREIPQKTKDFGSIIPGEPKTYIYHREADYYKDYQSSLFAITCKKGGWDCMRHYEILANGCIPYFINLERCPSHNMALLPKELILEAMHLKGVSYPAIDHNVFDRKKYEELLQELLQHVEQHLTTRAMANYLLKTIDYRGNGKILFLSGNPGSDYLRCLTLIGLKEVLGARVVDVLKIEHIYQTYHRGMQGLWGKGFSYTNIVDDLPVDRENIEQRILAKEFDLVIYGSLHRGLPHLDLVQEAYEPNQIIYLCGEDHHRDKRPCKGQHPHLFLREAY